MTNEQRQWVSCILEWSERGFTVSGNTTGGVVHAVGGAYGPQQAFEEAAVQLARSMVSEEAALLGEDSGHVSDVGAQALEVFVKMLDDRAIEFRRAYRSDSLEAFLAWARARVSPAVQAAFEMAVEPRLREEAKPPPAPLETCNRFMVTAHDGGVLMRNPLTFRVFTMTEALQLAAWLIVGAELADYDRALETAVETVKAIRAT